MGSQGEASRYDWINKIPLVKHFGVGCLEAGRDATIRIIEADVLRALNNYTSDGEPDNFMQAYYKVAMEKGDHE